MNIEWYEWYYISIKYIYMNIEWYKLYEWYGISKSFYMNIELYKRYKCYGISIKYLYEYRIIQMIQIIWSFNKVYMLI